ncbi:Peptidoglycan binding-like [Dillenia turbinata]|uniref:Peptidoglycan binding-like n=1 Tax=Dillenia turbinata TaxID=194707 RepID=A0AAN8YVG3_9MAGN
MTSSSSFPLSLNPNLGHSHLFSSQFPFSKPSSFSPPHSPPKSLVCFASLPPNQSNFDREEIRWLREEQRWLREEQRWLREEQRWSVERNSLLQQISELKLKIQTLELQNQGGSVSGAISKIGTLLQKLKDSEFIAEKETNVSPMVLGIAETEEVVVEQIMVLDKKEVGEEKKVSEKKRNALRKGAEGEEVRAMQEALQSLGFYSGEEDIEYSSFSSGTERAVKTWQSMVGAPEDGIMTLDLLERLYIEQRFKSDGSNLNSDRKKEDANGAAVASVTEVSEVKQKVVKEDGVSEVEVSQQRVFLLGENRWEEPSRLVGTSKQVVRGKTKNESTKCLACRGEGRLICTECDGTGEPNVEPQRKEQNVPTARALDTRSAIYVMKKQHRNMSNASKPEP